MELIPIKDWKKIDPNGIAIEVAKKSPLDFKLGAIILDKKGRVISWGYNKYKTHTSLGVGKFKMLHAETDAIYLSKKLGINISGMTMLVFRRNNCISKPCPGCQEILKKYKIAKVYYSVK